MHNASCAGKTYTMEGTPGESTQGIIPASFDHIFSAIGASHDRQYLVRASFLEIYNEDIRDLLAKNPKNRLELREGRDGGVYVKGHNSFAVKSRVEISRVLEV